MDREQIKEIMRDIFGRNFLLTDLGNWVGMKCPLAPYTHEKGTDRTPSAGISVDPNGASGFNCFTCGPSGTAGPMSRMLEQYAEYSGENLDDVIEEIAEGEFLGPRHIPDYDTIRASNIVDVAMPIDEGLYMDLYESAEGHPYLKRRGISKKTTRKLELLYDPKDSEREPRILFPVRGIDGLLYGFTGRATRPTARLKVRDYFGLQKSQCLLGSHLATDASRIVIVEGLIDYASAHEFGECGCAVLHATVTDEQASIIKQIGKPTFMMLDADKAGRDGTATAARKLHRDVPLFGTAYPRVKIEDDSEQGWHWLKDPGESTKEEFLSMLAKASLL